MEKIDYQRELNRIFAEYASFFTLPLKTAEGKEEEYTKLPRTLFAHFLMKEALIMELMMKGTISLKEVRDDCQALHDIAEGDFKGMEKPSVCLKVSGIPEARWYLFLPLDKKGAAVVPPPSVIEFAQDPGQDPKPEPIAKERPRILAILPWAIGIMLAFFAGTLVHFAPGPGKAPPPVPVVVTETPTATATATETPTDTSTATATPRPKPKPKPKVVKPKPTATPTVTHTPVAIPADAGLIF